MEIANIQLYDTGRGMFTTHSGIVKTKDGRLLTYCLDYNRADGTWSSVEDYFEQIRYDFEIEVANDPENTGECCIFDEITEEDLETWYRKSELVLLNMNSEYSY